MSFRSRCLATVSVVLSPVSRVTAVSVTGFITDNYCWDLPNHIAVDGTNMELAPQNHFLHCMQPTVLPQCETKGYSLLEEYTDLATSTIKYRPRYHFDKPGNELMIQLIDDEVAQNGDRRFAEQITVTGDVVDGTSSNNEEHRKGLDTPAAGQDIILVKHIRSEHADASKVVTVGSLPGQNDTALEPTQTPSGDPTEGDTEPDAASLGQVRFGAGALALAVVVAGMDALWYL